MLQLLQTPHLGKWGMYDLTNVNPPLMERMPRAHQTVWLQQGGPVGNGGSVAGVSQHMNSPREERVDDVELQ